MTSIEKFSRSKYSLFWFF